MLLRWVVVIQSWSNHRLMMIICMRQHICWIENWWPVWGVRLLAHFKWPHRSPDRRQNVRAIKAKLGTEKFFQSHRAIESYRVVVGLVLNLPISITPKRPHTQKSSSCLCLYGPLHSVKGTKGWAKKVLLINSSLPFGNHIKQGFCP